MRHVLLTGRAGQRLLNETSILLDVWARFAARDEPVDLLLTPNETLSAATLARRLHDTAPAARLISVLATGEPPVRHIVPLQGVVAARVDFADFVQLIVPATGLNIAVLLAELRDLVQSARRAGDRPHDDAATLGDYIAFARSSLATLSPDHRAALLLQLINSVRPADDGRAPPAATLGDLETLLPKDLLRRPPRTLRGLGRGRPSPEPEIWRVSLNRPVAPLGTSVQTIKADAAQRVFDLDCGTLTWAVIDSGIDGSHPAFRDHAASDFGTRVLKAYDFSGLRALVSYDTLLDGRQLDAAVVRTAQRLRLSAEEAGACLARLREDAAAGRPYDWEVLSRIIEVEPDRLGKDADGRPNGHGTHVAGVLAGDWREGEQIIHQGVCPTLRLYDLRVLGSDGEDTEFGVIAALEFVRWLNGRNRFITIHGVNLSIGLHHDVANYACGRTPVCLACEATVASGVVVVAAAGNGGAQDFQTIDGPFFNYAAMSILDPGNAQSVITVGATHRERPHEYGVSFFSSRGPTGDGRCKPDVVAPGERIDGPLPDLGLGRMDGTSMAAPHVSGVAALLLARHPELIGDAVRVKSIIIASATDLGRERHFQGAGLVDALRALQSI